MLIPHPIITKVERLFALTDSERASISSIQVRPLAIGAYQNLVREGDRPSRCILIISGLADTSKVDEDGKRQVTAFHVPGDMPDLLSLHLDVLDSDIRTVSECTVAFVDHGSIRILCDNNPRLAAALWKATLIDASVFREWVVNVGRRPALNRIAHLFCEIMCRMEAVGLANELSCQFNVTQADLSEATGLSVVHINRMLQELRKRKLISFVNGQLTIHDWPQMSALAGFRPTYLHLRDQLPQMHRSISFTNAKQTQA